MVRPNQRKEATVRNHRSRLLPVGALVAALQLSAPAMAGGMAPDLQKMVEKAPTSTTQTPIIVQYQRKGVDGATKAKRYGGSLVRKLGLITGDFVKVPLSKMKAFTADVDVRWVS